MPTYLCHGFRWHRRDIRIFVILHDLEDAAPDWLVGRESSMEILSHFYTLFDFLPEREVSSTTAFCHGGDDEDGKHYGHGNGNGNGNGQQKESKKALHLDDDFSVPPSRVPIAQDHVLGHEWSAVKLLEEYDDEDEGVHSRSYGYVADYVVRVDLSASVGDEMRRYEDMVRKDREAGREGWFEKLRDKLQAGAEMGWYVVVCSDIEREVVEEDAVVEEEQGEEDEVKAMEKFRIFPPNNDLYQHHVAPTGRPTNAYTEGATSFLTAATTQDAGNESSATTTLHIAEGAKHQQPETRHGLRSRPSVAAGLRKLFKKKSSSKLR